MSFHKLTFVPLFGFVIALASCNQIKHNPEVSNKHTTEQVDSFEILRPSLWVYGMIQPKDRQRQIVDAWYKFRFRIIAGDVVTDSLVRAANEHNRRTDSVLAMRIGKDWRAKFERTVDSLYSSDSLAIEIAKADKYIFNFDTTTEKHNDKYDYYPNLTYTVHPTTDENIKVVVVEGFGVVYGRVGWVSYLRARIDMKKKKVISMDTTQYGTE